jgi:hypothetical protein
LSRRDWLIVDFVSGLSDHRKYDPVNVLSHNVLSRETKKFVGNQYSANIVYGKGLSKEKTYLNYG